MTDLAQRTIDLHLFGTRKEIADFYRAARKKNTRAARKLKKLAEASVDQAFVNLFMSPTLPDHVEVGIGKLLSRLTSPDV